MLTDHVVFITPHFKVEAGEDEDTNPGIFGKALAEWLAARLKERGVSVEGVIAEDFGRCVIVKRKPYMLCVACASLDGSSTQWQMFIVVERGLMARLRGADPSADLERLRREYRSLIVAIPDVSAIEWRS